ncbi:MAG: translation elongation factor Ts [Candidatus Wildermuthbacteria bacterium RIFCSPLOWO2_02_FULL_47_9c]|uniref:Elongation factor Ts n=2 Tax=Parcubacteria group TaxID=1794811 RepID=A0A837ISH0_9BACT|nr:MAG: Elongation factor Ts [Candidatus Yanofskybacteria bacterium GW2011_GWC1_48_11]KKW04168.1 MAG: Elongation factor Ts [Parcubacteria group bacterium GW2011_GWB1_49_12]KKW08443.1 MAG: Elongation factor Ts [Parcubacteria group bacterium GW2011_GWA1_49_26]KKW14374.1 MAG: Elongation factor Ts [Parcubacteria group bacterium GW2011_GWA2_50_10]OHA61214.1 MAG: translation elongation factor Ts [Candidatus Wildermuthbacteria bacterium GWA1_49_26]OHA65669.1 MAG: translation elongation factor Ts [Can
MISVEQIKELREVTGISISECKKALEETGGDMERAKALLKEWGREVAVKKQERQVGEGLVASYVHGNGKIGSLVAVRCETDFVARSDDFKNLCHELALQIASLEAENVEELLLQQYIRDPGKTVRNVIEEAIAKLGENIAVEKFVRFHI